MANARMNEEGLRVKLAESLHYFDAETSVDVFIPAGTDGRAIHVTEKGVTVEFSAALIGPQGRKAHEGSTVETEWTVDDLSPSLLIENTPAKDVRVSDGLTRWLVIGAHRDEEQITIDLVDAENHEAAMEMIREARDHKRTGYITDCVTELWRFVENMTAALSYPPEHVAGVIQQLRKDIHDDDDDDESDDE